MVYDVSELRTQVPEETAVRFVRGSHKMGWFTPRKFATQLNYEREDNTGLKTTHEFRDVPVDDIEGGKFGPTLSWATQPGDVIAFYGKSQYNSWLKSGPYRLRDFSGNLRQMWYEPQQKNVLTTHCTEIGLSLGTWFRECCRQVEADVVSNSRNKLHETWVRNFSRSL